MPRQLPWAKRGSGSRTQAKPADPRPSAASRIHDIDDDFFENTILASSSKSTKQANESDDDLPNLPAEPSTLRTKSKPKDTFWRGRDESSSPPPVRDVDQPLVEGMHEGVTRWDLRDDRWMMVEDEFLETAKLFTRHLHIAEYGKLKEMIDAKKKGAEVARPVVANAKMSTSGAMKEKAKVQEQRQKRAIRDVFASQDDDEEEHGQATTSIRTTHGKTPLSTSGLRRAPSAVVKQPPTSNVAPDSDSEDLDAPQHPAKSASKPTPAKISSTPDTPKAALSPAPNTNIATPTFAKPAPPRPAAKSRSRISRATPFDMLDEWVPSKPQPSSPKASPDRRAGSPVVASRTPNATRFASRSLDFSRDVKLGVHAPSASLTGNIESLQQEKEVEGGGRSKELADRLAKRKAEREKSDGEKKRKKASADDIPTFLF
ncbi:hypothetical protein DDE82_003043 [Stemphylium lycopersici]|nr:hypothetical protein DDE82_003043 [Stemphylium lycopersici]